MAPLSSKSLVDIRCAYNLRKDLWLSYLPQLSYVLVCYVWTLRSPPWLFSTLFLPLVATSLLHSTDLCAIQFCHVGFFFTSCSFVMVPWLVIYGAATKPRASCGGRHMAVLLGTCRYRDPYSWSFVELHQWNVISWVWFWLSPLSYLKTTKLDLICGQL